MKKLLIILLFPMYFYGQKDTVTDTLVLPINDTLIGWKSLHENGIKQKAFFSFGIWHLVTNDGSLYDNIIHGSLEFIEANKIIEYNKALAKRKPIAVVTAKCDFIIGIKKLVSK